MTATETRRQQLEAAAAQGAADYQAGTYDPFATIPGAYDEDDAPPAVAAPTRTVRDNATYAWRNSDQSCLDSLPGDFVHDYRDALSTAAVAALDGPTGVLSESWLACGYQMLPCAETAMGELDRELPDELFHEVWDTAAARLDGHALAEAAGLGQELLDYQDTDTDRDYS